MHIPSAPILLVEDTITLARLYEEFLMRDGFKVITAATGYEAMEALEKTKPAAIILDLLLPDMNGLEILSHVHKTHPDIPVIVATINNSIDVAVEAMRKGAYDFIVKPFSAPRLICTLKNALKIKTLADEVETLKKLACYEKYYAFVGQSAPMQAMYRTIDAVAPSRATVFLQGESGTGKELAALSIHRASPRREKPFIAINCAAIPADLMESTLFGYIKGAFTGAINDQMGAAKAAHGGTLFLDEICEMPFDMQTKLLRFLQTNEVVPVGSNRVDIVDVRIIAATNRNPQEEVAARRMREDLFYRLSVIPIEVPPLRDRDDDILILASHFMARFNAEEGKEFTTLSPAVISVFRNYTWPGNVRQLENVIRHIVILNQGSVIDESMLPKDLKQFAEERRNAANQNVCVMNTEGIKPETDILPLWMVEKQTILATLDYTNHDIHMAAHLLEISPSTLYRKLQSWRGVQSDVPMTKTV